MKLARVTGKVISTRKDPGLEGARLLVVEEVGVRDMKTRDQHLVAVDSVGANEGDVVLVVTGSSARFAEGLKDKPVDTAIVGIVDHISIEGRTIFSTEDEIAGASAKK